MARQVNILGLIWPRSVVTWEGMSSKNFVNITAENINLLSHSRVEQFMLSTAWLLLMMLSLRKQQESVTSGCDLESVGNRSADESKREKTQYLFLSENPTYRTEPMVRCMFSLSGEEEELAALSKYLAAFLCSPF